MTELAQVQHPRPVALIVEDDDAVRRVLTKFLESLGFSALAAADADEADRLVLAHEPRLVLLDLRLPGRCGDDWLYEFRLHDRSTPVIVVSGVADRERRISMLRNGADDFIAKPFDLEELGARVVSLFRRPRSIGTRTALNGRLVIEPGRLAFHVKGNTVLLTSREFGLLWCLAAHEGFWMSAQRLCVEVLGLHSGAALQQLRVHVHKLRRKLVVTAPFAEIESERGSGYRLTDRDRSTA